MNLNRIKWYNLFCFVIILLAFLSCTKEWPQTPVESTRPEIMSISPDMWEFMVSPSTTISLTFDELMDLETIRDHASITDADGNTVSGSWSSNGNTAIFTPSTNLSTLTRYDVMIEGAFENQKWKEPGPRDVHGNSLYDDFTSHFATEGDFGAGLIYLGPGPNWGDRTTVARVSNLQDVVTLEGFEGAQGIDLNSDGSILYVADPEGNAVGVVETAGFSISETVALPDSVEDAWIVGVKPDDSEVWVLCRGTNHLVVIETVNNTITHVLPLNDYCLDGGFLYHILFSSDGERAFVSTRLSKSVLKINTNDYEVKREKVVDEVEHIQGFWISPDDSKLYLGNTWGMEPSIVIVSTEADMPTLGTIDLPEEWGDSKDMTSYGNYLYVSLRWMGIIYKIDMTTEEVLTYGWAGDEPEEVGLESIDIDPSGKVIYAIAPDQEGIAVFNADDITFLGYIDSGSWWQIVTR